MQAPSSPRWDSVSADRQGVRDFSSQMKLDEKGVELLRRFFVQAYRADVTPANKTVQLRGVDICVKVPGRANRAGPVGVDIKGDGTASGNLTLEVCSQDRPNSKRPIPAPGWLFKDMPFVAYCFLRTGDLLMLDMPLLTPWVRAHLERLVQSQADQEPAPRLTPRTWVTATPNAGYLSYNFVLPITDLVREAPGVTCFNLVDFLGVDVYQEIMGTLPEKRLIHTPVNTLEAFEHLGQRLLEQACYDIKPQLPPEDTERVLRWMEQVVRFSSRPGVKEAGEALKASRPHLALPEDAVAELA